MISLCVVLVLCCSGCSNADAGYDEAFDAIANDIDSLNSSTDYIASYVSSAWSKLGVDDLPDFLEMSSTITKTSEVGLGTTWRWQYRLIDKVFGTNSQKANGKTAQDKEVDKVIPYFLSYQESLKNGTEKNDSLTAAIKEFKEKYEKKHGDAVAALVQYYLDSSAYFEYTVSLSGKNLATYQKETGSYQQAVAASRKAAELSK